MSHFIRDGKFYLHEIFQKWSLQTAIKGPRLSITYQQWKEQIGLVIRNLQQVGISEGDYVGIYLDNNLEYITILFAVWILKGKVALIPCKYPAAEVQQVANDLSLKYLIVDRTFTPNDSGPPFKKSLKILTGPLNINARVSSHYFRFESWILDLDREITLLFSSGSTGKPKKVIHSLKNYLESALGSISFYIMDSQDSYVLSLPLNHIGGVIIIWRMLLIGGTLILPSSLKNIESCIRLYHPSYVSLVGTQLVRFLSKEYLHKYLRKMKGVIVGGGPIPDWTINYCKNRDIPLILTYGMTELTSQITSTRPHDDLVSHKNSGTPLPHIKIKFNQKNEILVKGSSLFLGEMSSEGKVVSQLDQEGWFLTKDIGEFDNQGALHVHGRSDLMFISGGENIYPASIEEAIKKIPWVIDSIVVPISHQEFGYAPLAFIESLRKIPLKKVITHLKNCLPNYMIPKKIIFLDDNFPKMGIKHGRKRLEEYAHKVMHSRS